MGTLNVENEVEMRKIENSGVDVGVYEISPEDASALLQGHDEGGHPKRSLNQKGLSRLKESHASGQFVMNGESIVLSPNGSEPEMILNGRHRLTMIAETKIPAVCVVVKNVPKDVFWTYDDGSKRTLAQVLQMRGEINCAALGATIQLVNLFLGGDDIGRMDAPPKSRALEILDEYPSIRDSVRSGLISR